MPGYQWIGVVQIAYIAGLLAAVCWGGSPVISRRGFSYGGSPMLVTVIVITTGVTMFWGALLVLQGPANFLPELTLFGYGIFLFGGIVGTSLGRISNYTGIDHVGASINSAIVAGNPVTATILAFVFLGELITVIQAVGVIVVVFGIVTLTVSKGGNLTGWDRRDLVFPLLAGVAYGSGSVIRRFGLTATSATPLEAAALNETAALIAIGSFLLVRRKQIFERLPLRAYSYFVATGVVSALGLVMLFTGLQNGRVAIVTTLSGASGLFTTAFSYFLLDDLEQVTKGVAGGATLVVAGITMITLL